MFSVFGYCSQLSNLSQSSQRSKIKRRRRRRSQGSISATEVTNTQPEVSAQSENRSQNSIVDRTIGSHDQSHDRVVQSTLVSPDQSNGGITGSHDNLGMTVGIMERVSEERETQSSK